MKRLIKLLFGVKTSKKKPSENYYRAIPSQALKTWRHFPRFNVELYHDYLIEINKQ